MRQRVTVALAAALSIAALIGPIPVSAQVFDDRFEKKTKAELERLEIPEENVESVRIVILRSRRDRSSRISGAESWSRLTFCTGYLVIVMNRGAFVQDIYTRGDCSIPGLKSR